MDKTTEIIKVKEYSIWDKIKNFFKKKLFKKEEYVEINEESTKKEYIEVNKTSEESTKEGTNPNNKPGYFESMKDTNELLELQGKYRSGEIKESDLTSEQLKALNNLYDKQIRELRATNEARKQRLLKYREKMTTAKI